MENENCLAGMRCPKCHAKEPFDIEATSVFRVYDDGTEEHTNVEWGDDSSCACRGCGYVATVKEFTIQQMTLIELPCYGIVVETDGKGGGTIRSDLHMGLTSGRLDQAVLLHVLDGIESMILGCACAGIDISQPAFLEAIETAVQSAHSQYD